MSLLPWKRRDLQQQLSAYLDGELDPQKVPSMGEDLVFDLVLLAKLDLGLEIVDFVGPAGVDLTREGFFPATRGRGRIG